MTTSELLFALGPVVDALDALGVVYYVPARGQGARRGSFALVARCS